MEKHLFADVGPDGGGGSTMENCFMVSSQCPSTSVTDLMNNHCDISLPANSVHKQNSRRCTGANILFDGVGWCFHFYSVGKISWLE